MTRGSLGRDALTRWFRFEKTLKPQIKENDALTRSSKLASLEAKLV